MSSPEMASFDIRSLAEARELLETFEAIPDPVLGGYLHVEVRIREIDAVCHAAEIYGLFLDPIDRFGWTVTNMDTLDGVADVCGALEFVEEVLDDIVQADDRMEDVDLLQLLKGGGAVLRFLGGLVGGELRYCARTIGQKIVYTAQKVLGGEWDEARLLYRVDMHRELVAYVLEAGVIFP